jgi:hypothetical protein
MLNAMTGSLGGGLCSGFNPLKRNEGRKKQTNKADSLVGLFSYIEVSVIQI